MLHDRMVIEQLQPVNSDVHDSANEPVGYHSSFEPGMRCIQVDTCKPKFRINDLFWSQREWRKGSSQNDLTNNFVKHFKWVNLIHLWDWFAQWIIPSEEREKWSTFGARSLLDAAISCAPPRPTRVQLRIIYLFHWLVVEAAYPWVIEWHDGLDWALIAMDKNSS